MGRSGERGIVSDWPIGWLKGHRDTKRTPEAVAHEYRLLVDEGGGFAA